VASLEDYAEFERGTHGMNLQTRFLSGNIDVRAPSIRGEPLPEDALEKAKAHVDDCLVFGLVEQFDVFLALLQRAMGWDRIFYTPRNLDYTRADALAGKAAIMEWIGELNHLDVALVEHARARFAERVEAAGEDLEREVERMRRMSGVGAGLRKFYLLPPMRKFRSVVKRLAP
jgi:hypothetical protein